MISIMAIDSKAPILAFEAMLALLKIFGITSMVTGNVAFAGTNDVLRGDRG